MKERLDAPNRAFGRLAAVETFNDTPRFRGMTAPVHPLQLRTRNQLATRNRRDATTDTRTRVATDVVIGGISGVVATLAMTLVADALFRKLPRAERYPLPPRELTEQAAASFRVRNRLGEDALQAATLASHFGFGFAAGSAYPSLLLGSRIPPVVSGVGYALAVWAGSYFGWVPLLGWLRPASQHPARRNAVMIVAHVVWGSVLGVSANALRRALAPIGAGPLRDR
jgi:hypothetical protein